MKFITREDKEYPEVLQWRLGERAPAALTIRGDVTLLHKKRLAFFCSDQCPPELISPTCHLAQIIQNKKMAIIGGFHSRVEREVLKTLMSGRGELIICPARGIKGMPLPRGYRKLMRTGRLLLISPFPGSVKLTDKRTRASRNRLAAALADAVLVTYAHPGGAVERICREVLQRGQPLYTFTSPHNENLLALGAIQIGEE